MIKNCEKCLHYVKSLHSTNPDRPDARCGHKTAQVGFNDEPPYEIQSLLTIHEARLPRSSRKENSENFKEYDQCGPNATYFEQNYASNRKAG